MKNRFLHKRVYWVVSALLYFLLWGNSLQAQSGVSFKAAVDRSRIYIGEQIEFTLTLEYPQNKKPGKWVAMPDSLNHLEVVKRLNFDSSLAGDKYRLQQKYILTGFDSGHWIIPAFTVSVSNKSYKTDTIGINILPVALKGEAYHDIKEIIEVDAKPFDWTYWIMGAVTVLIIAFLLWQMLKGRKKKEAKEEFSGTKLSPYEQAVQEMKKLKEEQLPEKGEMKIYYTKLTDIFRVFLQRQFNQPMLQSTTDEILVYLNGDILQREKLGPLAETLRVADAVKFAKYPSSVSEGSEGFKTIEEIIQLLHRQKT
ncbi:MAG: BatD family protein [Chitinophagaceae bacterium]|nr:BatD family protein [Chitinophagaceae bacterium]